MFLQPPDHQSQDFNRISPPLTGLWRTTKGTADSLRFVIKSISAVTLDFQQCGMCDQQRLRPACSNTQSDQSLCLSLVYSMTAKLLTEHNLEEAAQARLSLLLSKCHIVGNHRTWLISKRLCAQFIEISVSWLFICLV